jgi:cation:H+ antiporter
LLLGAGTSLPELVTSIVAAARGQREIALGNALGSSVFNLLAVLGLAGLLAPGGLHVSARALAFELPAAALAVPLCALALLSRSRGGALALLGCYAIYVAATVGGAAAGAAP